MKRPARFAALANSLLLIASAPASGGGRLGPSAERVSSMGGEILGVLSGGPEGDAGGRKLFDRQEPAEGRTAGPVAAFETAALSQEDLKAEMLQALDSMRAALKAQYGPREWKKEFAGWDLDLETERAKARVRASRSVKELQRTFKEFLQTTRDYHVRVGFSSTESASLPLSIRNAEGRYFIAWIDRRKLPETLFPFQPGDELTSFGGKPAAEAAAEVRRELGRNVDSTDEALAALLLASRRGASGMTVPKDAVDIGVRRKGAGETRTFQLMWDYTPELVRWDRGSVGPQGLGQNPGRIGAASSRWSADNALSPVLSDLSGLPADNPHGLGRRKGFLPPMGKILYETESEEPFHAYIYEPAEGGGRFGYVRIPSYSVGGEGEGEADRLAQTLLHLGHFASLMAKFQAETDGLVIDQLNNPGGSVFYMYTLLSMLSPDALGTPRHRIAITAREVAAVKPLLDLEHQVRNNEDALRLLGPSFGGYPVSHQLVQFLIRWARFIVDEWEAGRRLTDPTHLYGVDKINPFPAVQYAKPILVLVNELDFSGGDFFPSILQDNGRARIFGVRTSGAGGFVTEHQFPNQLGVESVSITGSLARRPTAGGPPIENLGVTPDMPRPFTAQDLQDGYAGYVSDVNRAIGAMTAGKDPPKKP